MAFRCKRQVGSLGPALCAKPLVTRKGAVPKGLMPRRPRCGRSGKGPESSPMTLSLESLSLRSSSQPLRGGFRLPLPNESGRHLLRGSSGPSTPKRCPPDVHWLKNGTNYVHVDTKTFVGIFLCTVLD